MSVQPFVHLHCHTHYSLLDGASRIPDLVTKAKASGMNALAVTDHGNLFGALEFYSAAKSQDINPILGYEAYVAPGHRTEKRASSMREASFHLTLLAKNRTGFQNLMKLASSAYLEGFHYRPRIDKELLAEHNEGLICLSGCASSELSHLILAEKLEEAEQLVAWYANVFGDRLFLEIQDCGLEIQQMCKEGTVELANRMGMPLVATNDAHYLNQEDAPAHDVLLCVNTNSLRAETKRMRMDGDQFYVRTPEEMYAAFADFPDAVARTQEIADSVDIDLDLETRHFPVFSPPENKTDVEYLRELCGEGMKWRYGDDITDEHRSRLDFELDVIGRMSYSSYFLIVWDFVRFARENGIPCQARGSACGSLVSYVLGISHVCPLKFDLLFERFLDPNRAEAPDIDIDFCRDRRQLVLNYTKQKYGEANVSQIGTFGTLKARAVIRDVSRALSVPLKRVDEIAKMVPETLNIALKDALKESPELKEAYDRDPLIHEVIDIGMRLEGLARSAGTHAAGVVIGDKPLVNYVPLQRITGKLDVITQWTDVEKAGLLKMDFLGLRNLSILDKAVQNVKRHNGIDIDTFNLPLDDKATFELLQRGETKGIFQLESGGMRDLLTKMKPDRFNDIIATSALYRPGPLEGGMVMTYVKVKHGQEPIPKLHPVVDEIVEETYGVMVYQEQVMRILNRLGGIDLSSAYRCIKAISKKKHSVIAKFREEFVEGAQRQNLDERKAVELFEMIEKFAGYGFNKSHSTAYAAIAYQTAYLKAHYPREFMAALLSCGMESSERIWEHVDDCRRMGVVVQPPDVNRSDVEFGVDGDCLTFGLAALKGVGEQAVGAIVKERVANGPYLSIFDLAERVDPKQLTKGVLEILIKAGGLDSLGPNRAQHMTAVERATQSAAARHRDKARGQKNLFGDETENADEMSAAESLPDVPDWPHRMKLTYEKETLGFYLTSHPLNEYADQLAAFASHETADLADLDDRAEVLVGGMISSIKKALTKKPTRNGNTRYVNFDLEDTRGTVRCIMWPDTFDKLGDQVRVETVCIIKGKVDRRGREPNIVVDSLYTIEQAEKEFTKQLAINFQRGVHTEQDMLRVRELLVRSPGRSEVVLVVDSIDERDPGTRLRYLLKTPTDLKVSCTPQLRADIAEIIGPKYLQVRAESARKNGKPQEASAGTGWG